MTSRCLSVRSLRVPEDPLRTTFLYGEISDRKTTLCLEGRYLGLHFPEVKRKTDFRSHIVRELCPPIYLYGQKLGPHAQCQGGLFTSIDLLILFCILCYFLPPANEVWGKVIFLHLSVILFTRGSTWASTPRAGTSPAPQAGRPPGRYTPWAGTPSRAGTPPTGTPPGNACWDTFNKREVRILLECILVKRSKCRLFEQNGMLHKNASDLDLLMTILKTAKKPLH